MEDSPESAEWLASARGELDVAQLLLSHGHWATCAFHAHQAAEKALKAVQIRKAKRFDRVHDISALCRSVDAPESLRIRATLLNAFYTGGRYPGAGAMVSERDAREALASAQEVVRWSTKS